VPGCECERMENHIPLRRRLRPRLARPSGRAGAASPAPQRAGPSLKGRPCQSQLLLAPHRTKASAHRSRAPPSAMKSSTPRPRWFAQAAAIATRSPGCSSSSRAEARERMAAAVEALGSSEGWKRWLAVRHRFHHYSFKNQLLIAHQRPGATWVASFSHWLKLGYCVRKGERSIRIWKPCRAEARKDALPYALAGYAGARKQEIEILDWSHLNLDLGAGELAGDEEGRKPGGSWRIVFFVKPLWDLLREEWEAQGRPSSGRVCPPRATRRSGRIALSSLHKRIAGRWRELGLDPIGFHQSPTRCDVARSRWCLAQGRLRNHRAQDPDLSTGGGADHLARLHAHVAGGAGAGARSARRLHSRASGRIPERGVGTGLMTASWESPKLRGLHSPLHSPVRRLD
jgi:antirestriction factor ArdC-like protein